MRKSILVLTLVAGIAAVSALPYNKEEQKAAEYALVPDGNGNFHLVDINEDPEPENRFTPANDVIFQLYTRSNRVVPQVLRLNDAGSITGSNFNVNHALRIIVHGWNSDGSSAVNILTRDAYLELGDFNVVVVDWGAGAQTPNYVSARNRVGGVGAHLADFVRFLNKIYDVRTEDVTIVGHSLGAHVAGFTGKNIVGNMKLGSVIGLDAALPLFNINAPLERLAETDALYVESIHTNAGQLGFDLPLGHANFYPNFGGRQPGCGIDVSGSCAHSRAVEYYAESINSPRGFWGRQCRGYDDILLENCVATGIDRKMGGVPADTGARGVFWLRTNNRSPFAMGVA